MDTKTLLEIFSHYDFNEDQYVGTKSISIGHINTTLVLYFDYGNRVKRYLLQKINTNAFKDPDKLMQNIENVTTYVHDLLKGNHVENYKHKFLRIYKTKDDKTYVKLNNGDYYRVYHYVEGCITINQSTIPSTFYNAGKTIGSFQRVLENYPSEKLYETIPNFHNTPKRYDTFINILEKADRNLVNTCHQEIEFYKNHKDIAYSIQSLIDANIMPLHVTHNDTKLNNIMFNYDTNEGQCLIDLDTIMPGPSCYDFGDFVRSGCNMGKEDDEDLDKVIFSKSLFLSFVKGYLNSVVDCIQPIELENLTMGAIVMTYECGIRFLSDYLDGNHYFHVDYETHNLIRCRTQIKMVEQMMACKDELDQDIINIYNEIKSKNNDD